MTELKPMHVGEVMTYLVPVSLAELRAGSKIERDKVRLDLGIITAFVLSCRCEASDDYQMFEQARQELREAIKSVQDNLSGNVTEPFEGLTSSFTYFVSLVNPGLSVSIENSLISN